MRNLLSVLVAVGVAACGGDDRPVPTDSGPTIPIASARPQVAFEGHRNMAIELTAPDDLTGATVEPESPDGPLTVIESRCSGMRCGVVVAIADDRPSMGIPIPAPIHAENQFLSIVKGDQRWRAVLSVQPLDAISNGSTTPAPIGGVQLAASVSSVAGSTFRGMSAEPVRWIVFGGGAIGGAIDVSAEATNGLAGGHDGGPAGAMGAGPAAGSAAPVAGAGGGGAGGSVAGEAGAGADGTAGAGGAGGERVTDASCVDDFTAAACGGSGGGGAAGPGGGGGGALLLVSLAPLDLSGATLRAAGGDGAEGGGGGAGGLVVVAAPEITGAPAVEAPGGVGAAPGGAGADGFVVASEGADASAPSVSLAGISQITDQPTLTLTGHAAPDASIAISAIAGGATGAATADATGAWSAEVTLSPGLNRIAVDATSAELGTLVSWTGTNIDFEALPGAMRPLPVRATIDVVYVP